jgi:hypothetical protein
MTPRSGESTAFSRTITITATDQRAVRQALNVALLSIPLRITAAIVLPAGLVVGIIAVNSGDAIGFALFGALAALTFLFLALLVTVRVTSSAAVSRAIPPGSALTITGDVEGLLFAAPGGETRLRWSALSEVSRVRDALKLVLRPKSRTSVLYYPGRLLTDADLATITERISAVATSPR